MRRSYLARRTFQVQVWLGSTSPSTRLRLYLRGSYSKRHDRQEGVRVLDCLVAVLSVLVLAEAGEVVPRSFLMVRSVGFTAESQVPVLKSEVPAVSPCSFVNLSARFVRLSSRVKVTDSALATLPSWFFSVLGVRQLSRLIAHRGATRWLPSERCRRECGAAGRAHVVHAAAALRRTRGRWA